jgi:hypothetical protein
LRDYFFGQQINLPKNGGFIETTKINKPTEALQINPAFAFVKNVGGLVQ